MVNEIGLTSSYTIYECANCLCRYVWRYESEKDTFEKLYRSDTHYYSTTVDYSKVSKYLFDKKDVFGLYRYLSRVPVYKYIIDSLDTMNDLSANLLEIGSSRGHLGAYFLLRGYNYLGGDISSTSVQDAKEKFGDHYVVLDGYDDVFSSGSFDYIFHAGTIGCVDDPVELTRRMVSALKPGGKLLFNSPDVIAASERNSAWLQTTAAPPDLITLFHESFWKNNFSDLAKVEVSYEPYHHRENISKNIHEFLLRGSKTRVESRHGLSNNNKARRILSRITYAILHSASRWGIIHRYTMNFGMFICLTKNDHQNLSPNHHSRSQTTKS